MDVLYQSKTEIEIPLILNIINNRRSGYMLLIHEIKHEEKLQHEVSATSLPCNLPTCKLCSLHQLFIQCKTAYKLT